MTGLRHLSVVLLAGVVVACPSTAPKPKPTGPTTAQPKPAVEVDPASVPAAEEKPAQAAEAAEGTAEVAANVEVPANGDGPVDISIDAGGLAAAETLKEREAREAAELRKKEEEELAQKEEARLEAEKKRKQAQAKLDGYIDNASELLKKGEDEAALQAFQKATTDLPDSPVAYYNFALSLERQGQREKAIAAYREALKLKSDFEQASDNLTRLYVRASQLQRAERELRRRILLHPRNLAFRNQLVRVLIEQGGDRLGQAESQSKKVLKIDERNVDAMLNLATIWFREGKHELAKMVLDNAREIHKTNPAIWNLLAFTQLKLDQKSLALESFKKAAELRSDFPEAHNNLGAMLNEVNDCAGAIRELELAVKYAPSYAQAHMNLGNAYRCARQYKKAQKEYELALELDKRPGGSRKLNDPFFNLAILYLDGDIEGWEKLKRLEQSVAYFQEYIDRGGEDPRTERYLKEANKAITKEQKRIKRAIARKKKKEAREEKKRQERAALLASANALKIQGKGDFEDDVPKPTPSPTEPPAAAVGEGAEAGTPVAPKAPPKMDKVPKEDL